MIKLKHPINRYERLVSEQKKAAKRRKEHDVKIKLAKEELKLKETEDELHTYVEGSNLHRQHL